MIAETVETEIAVTAEVVIGTAIETVTEIEGMTETDETEVIVGETVTEVEIVFEIAEMVKSLTAEQTKEEIAKRV